jgi:hypothetical protein
MQLSNRGFGDEWVELAEIRVLKPPSDGAVRATVGLRDAQESETRNSNRSFQVTSGTCRWMPD